MPADDRPPSPRDGSADAPPTGAHPARPRAAGPGDGAGADELSPPSPATPLADGHDQVTDLDQGSPAGPVEPGPGPRALAARAALRDVPQVPGAPKPDPVLVADGVVRRFGGLTAVDVQHVEIQRGAITALIGPNGAGKTTFFNLLTGFDRPDEGSWTFEGRSLSRVPAHRVARRGMVRTFQLTKALSRLTVIENMRLGAAGQVGERLLQAMFRGLWKGQEDSNTRRADELLRRFKLDAKREDFAGSLSGGQRKLLEMARALMTEPRMVMLDEPMAGVNPALTQSLLGHVKDLREQGMTVLFVEHDMDMVRDISDWVIVMAQGVVVAEGPPDAVMADPAVIDAYLGGHHDAPLTEQAEQEQLAAAEAELEREIDQEASR